MWGWIINCLFNEQSAHQESGVHSKSRIGRLENIVAKLRQFVIDRDQVVFLFWKM